MSAHAPFRSSSAFTLIELLTVVAIVGILAAILFPIVGRARQAALRVECASNMRQVGIGIASYVADHRGQLPGPLYSGMDADYEPTPADNRLGSYVAPYLSLLNAPGNDTRRAALFSCPAWSQAAPDTEKFWGIQQSAVLLTNGTSQSPFGYVGSSQPHPWLAIASPSRTQALWDLDKLNWSAPTDSYLPATPVHGNVRNVLFFDWHVQAVSAP